MSVHYLNGDTPLPSQFLPPVAKQVITIPHLFFVMHWFIVLCVRARALHVHDSSTCTTEHHRPDFAPAATGTVVYNAWFSGSGQLQHVFLILIEWNTLIAAFIINTVD